MEKIKLIDSIIMKLINVNYLIKENYIISYFPLHDYYELETKKKKELFLSFINFKYFKSEKFKTINQHKKELKALFNDLADEAENTDFNSDGSCLLVETGFNWREPWSISIESMRNYFGEKIAIYFDYLSFYTLELVPMGFLGLIAQILILYGTMIQANAIRFG